jgi:hypothetical protein
LASNDSLNPPAEPIRAAPRLAPSLAPPHPPEISHLRALHNDNGDVGSVKHSRDGALKYSASSDDPSHSSSTSSRPGACPRSSQPPSNHLFTADAASRVTGVESGGPISAITQAKRRRACQPPLHSYFSLPFPSLFLTLPPLLANSPLFSKTLSPSKLDMRAHNGSTLERAIEGGSFFLLFSTLSEGQSLASMLTQFDGSLPQPPLHSSYYLRTRRLAPFTPQLLLFPLIAKSSLRRFPPVQLLPDNPHSSRPAR